MAGAYRDYIPEGESVGAEGKGFTDFVPTPEASEVAVPANDGKRDYELLTVRKLRELLEGRGVDTKKMNTKGKLIEALRAGDEAPTEKPVEEKPSE